MQQPTVGMETTFSKTVGEADVYGFAGISGDLSPNHVDEQYMSGTRYGKRIAHGVLSIAFMSTCSSKLIESLGNPPTVSYGYDRVRFIKPVFIGDTLTVRYTVADVDEQEQRCTSDVKVFNQDGELVSAATHILKRV
ncbi:MULTISPECIES: MaoC family dehydratase [Pseudonocardia]|uniref:Acyl dehydratase n=1 Tax=Pseudonocardia kunmingensis TaxID=630975 RepID=A0A543DVL5_9PSEU|nr:MULTISPECIES: MaoC/PaaZ C-terminal domain-containing protein [Pseudonocardia]TQM13370.1 acyl dehydratase [Pseudonocardia kunmingensis]